MGIGVCSHEYITPITLSTTPKIKNAIISTNNEVQNLLDNLCDYACAYNSATVCRRLAVKAPLKKTNDNTSHKPEPVKRNSFTEMDTDIREVTF